MKELNLIGKRPVESCNIFTDEINLSKHLVLAILHTKDTQECYILQRDCDGDYYWEYVNDVKGLGDSLDCYSKTIEEAIRDVSDNFRDVSDNFTIKVFDLFEQ